MLRDTAKTASLSSEKGARFCLSHSQARSLPGAHFRTSPLISALRRALRNRHSHSPRANVSMDSRSGKGAFMGSRLHAASTEKGLPTTHFAVCLPRPASHTLDDSPVTLLAQYIAEHFTCPLPHHCSIHSAYEAVHRLGLSLALRSAFWGCPTPFPRACARQAVSKKSLHSFTSPRKRLRTRDLRVKPSP